MLRLTVRVMALCYVLVCLVSCQGRNVKYFTLRVVAGEELLAQPVNPMQSVMRGLANYYEDTAITGTVFVPEVIVVRTDFAPPVVESLSCPLSPLNRWRRQIGLLPAANLIEDYSQRLGTLETCQLLSRTSGRTVSLRAMLSEYPNADTLTIGDGALSRLWAVRADIMKRLSNDSMASCVVILHHDTTVADHVISYRSDSSSQALVDSIETENRSLWTFQSAPDRIQRAQLIINTYSHRVGDEPLAIYSLCKTFIFRADHDEGHIAAFEMLRRAARKALQQGRAAELYRKISNDLEADLQMAKESRSIWRLSTIEHRMNWQPIIDSLTSDSDR